MPSFLSSFLISRVNRPLPVLKTAPTPRFGPITSLNPLSLARKCRLSSASPATGATRVSSPTAATTAFESLSITVPSFRGSQERGLRFVVWHPRYMYESAVAAIHFQMPRSGAGRLHAPGTHHNDEPRHTVPADVCGEVRAVGGASI